MGMRNFLYKCSVIQDVDFVRMMLFAARVDGIQVASSDPLVYHNRQESSLREE